MSCSQLLTSTVSRLSSQSYNLFPHLAFPQKFSTGLGLVVAGEDCLFDTERRVRQSNFFQAEPAVKVLDDSVALACGGFETFAVQYLHLTAHVFNQPGIF